MARKSLSNLHYTDRELLIQMAEVADDDGRIHPLDLAKRLSLVAPNEENPGAARGVSVRLGWMVRFGYLGRIDGQPVRYVITPDGEEIIRGSLRKAVDEAVENLNLGGQVLLMSRLADRGYVRGSRVGAAAVRRQWLHDMARRKR